MDFMSVTEAIINKKSLLSHEVFLHAFFLVVFVGSEDLKSYSTEFNYVTYIVDDVPGGMEQYDIVESSLYDFRDTKIESYAIYVESDNFIGNFYDSRYAGWFGSRYIIKVPVMIKGTLIRSMKLGFDVTLTNVTSVEVPEHGRTASSFRERPGKIL